MFPSGHIFDLVSFPETYYTVHKHIHFNGYLFTFPTNPLKKKRKLLYLKTQFVLRSKHFSSRL